MATGTTSAMPVKHLLILGGTTEARELARRVSLMIGKKLRVTTSLAGRRATTPALAGDVRVGGFGGAAGLGARPRARGAGPRGGGDRCKKETHNKNINKKTNPPAPRRRKRINI